jgi:hypothetical protein
MMQRLPFREYHSVDPARGQAPPPKNAIRGKQWDGRWQQLGCRNLSTRTHKGDSTTYGPAPAPQALTFQADEENKTQSYGTADSQDPTHENFEQESTVPPRQFMSYQAIYPFSPQRLENQGATEETSISPRPDKFEAGNSHPNQKQLRKARMSSEHAQEHDRGEALKQPPSQETQQSPPTTPPLEATTPKASGTQRATTTPPHGKSSAPQNGKPRRLQSRLQTTPPSGKKKIQALFRTTFNKPATPQQEPPAIRNENSRD